MAEGHGWGGASGADSNHPAPACASAAPPYPRRGVLLVLMSPYLVTGGLVIQAEVDDFLKQRLVFHA